MAHIATIVPAHNLTGGKSGQTSFEKVIVTTVDEVWGNFVHDDPMSSILVTCFDVVLESLHVVTRVASSMTLGIGS